MNGRPLTAAPPRLVYVAHRPGLMVGTTEFGGVFVNETGAQEACDQHAGRPLDWVPDGTGWHAPAGPDRAAGRYTVVATPVLSGPL